MKTGATDSSAAPRAVSHHWERDGGLGWGPGRSDPGAARLCRPASRAPAGAGSLPPVPSFVAASKKSLLARSLETLLAAINTNLLAATMNHTYEEEPMPAIRHDLV
jgi:hypothetical protein